MLASGFGETCPPEEARFSRDKRICDNCLATDYAVQPLKQFRNALAHLVFSFSALVAFIPIALMLRSHHERGLPLLLKSFAAAAIAGLVMVGLFFLVRTLIIRIGDSTYVRRKPEEARREAERFYYLALWAGLNGQMAFGKRMLRQAKQMGFNDPVRLHDPDISNFASPSSGDKMVPR